MSIADPFDLFTLPAWMDESLCSKVGSPEDWFPGPNDDINDVVATCNTCPVKAKCLDWALELEHREDGLPLGRHSRSGIFGGLTANQRHRLATGAA